MSWRHWNRCDNCGKFISIIYLEQHAKIVPECPHCEEPFMFVPEVNDTPEEIRALNAHADGY